jgi:hypothetical protein
LLCEFNSADTMTYDQELGLSGHLEAFSATPILSGRYSQSP